jgi:hypothetical protein
VQLNGIKILLEHLCKNRKSQSSSLRKKIETEMEGERDGRRKEEIVLTIALAA